ncbi:MAG: energy-coupling factor transporter ATPase [Lachnospiraceae bacterium]
MGLKIEDITYTYESGTAMSVNALNHITTEIPDGQFIGLIGHTGSGKSTFVQMLNGLLKASSGHIYYNGEDIDGDGYDKKALRANVGLVFQYPENQLFEADVLTDVEFGPKNLGLDENARKARAEKALNLVGLPEKYWKASPFDLSGGQKRRAAIAGVLAMEPKILILDEPTAGLDPRGRDEILGLVRDMKNKLDMTILLVSHSMEDVAEYVDRILVMNAGQIMLDGTPREVFSHVSELEKVGLAAPQMTYIMKDLAAAGLPVRTDCLTVEEAAKEILSHRDAIPVAKKGGSHA